MKRIALFCASLLLILASCTQPKQLEYKDVKNFRLRNISIEKPELGMDIEFYNPNDFGLSLKDANIDVFINNKFVGKANLTQSFDVPKLSNFLMPVALTPDIQGLFSNALLLAFNQPVDVQIKGSVKAGKGLFIPIPINYTGRVKLNVF